ncbi:DUF2272 domain-containing protein [Ruegeria atlantica]|uniref:DUF2272 domain-containing protein n=1 Tax=Ruegeria atlantica TaxID=81569 RepID=UPI001481534C|nr:DUF2272 domain-containing protein [Ruegeria atlantica]
MSEPEVYADFFAPQAYWFWHLYQKLLNQAQISGLRLKNPAEYSRTCVPYWKKAVCKRPVVKGRTCWGEHPTRTQAGAAEKLRGILKEFGEKKSLAGFDWGSFGAGKAMSPVRADPIEAADIGILVAERACDNYDCLPENGLKAVTACAANLRWVAVEGLKFRSSPDNSSDDNVREELDYGSSALILGPQTDNGYAKAMVTLDGKDAEGYLFAKYLRPNEAPKVELAIQEAVSEWLRFDKGGGFENKSPYHGHISEMWTARGYAGLAGKDREWFWSAAFISWILENAGYERTEFDIRHSTYIHESIQNKVLGRDRDFWGYRIDEAEPQVGDLLCQWRGTNETTYDEAEVKSKFESHTGIVIAVRDRAVVTLGGNVANTAGNGSGFSVETKIFRRKSNGLLANERRLFAVMKNQFRPKAEQALRA